MPTGREKWLGDLLRAGLETRVLAESDVLAHVTPAVLMSALPRAVMVRVLESSMASGTISPKVVLETVTADVLAAHVPHPMLWDCVIAGAERAGFAGANGAGEKAAGDKRVFLRRALADGIGAGVVTPKDVVQHVSAQVLGTSFPDVLTTKLLEVSLASGKMTPELVVETLGVEAIAEHAPATIVWAALAQAGVRSLAEPSVPTAKDKDKEPSAPVKLPAPAPATRTATASGTVKVPEPPPAPGQGPGSSVIVPEARPAASQAATSLGTVRLPEPLKGPPEPPPQSASAVPVPIESLDDDGMEDLIVELDTPVTVSSSAARGGVVEVKGDKPSQFARPPGKPQA